MSEMLVSVVSKCALAARVPVHLHAQGAVAFMEDARNPEIGWPRFRRWLDQNAGQAPSPTFWLGAEGDKEAA